MSLAPQPDQIWRHFKGGLYFVLQVGRMEADLEPVVVYSRIQHFEDPKQPVWVRPLSSWLEAGDLGHKQVSRFTYAGGIDYGKGHRPGV